MTKLGLWSLVALAVLVAYIDARATKHATGHKRQVKPKVAPVAPPVPALEAGGKISETLRRKLLAEINKYRLMHGVSPLGFCPVCATEAQKWVDNVAKTGHIKTDMRSKYGQTAFTSKDAGVMAKGADYIGTLIAASWYNQIKNYDFQSNQFKGAASDFTQLVWKESGVIGFGSGKGTDGAFYLIAYYSPGGNNETLGFADNVNRVTGAGDLDTTQIKCPDEWTLNGHQCYRYFGGKKTWSDAVEHCNVLKGSLVSIECSDDNLYVKALAHSKNGTLSWIGMSDTATKGTYQYVDGTPYVFSDFTIDSYTEHAQNVDSARGKCIAMNTTHSGWQYSDCNTPLPFICKLKPNGVLSFAIQLYFPGSSYTSDLVDATQPRYINLKSTIEKAVNETYGKDIWFSGVTLYQFWPRENKEIAATIMLRFAPDNRAPVDPVNKLRDFLKKEDNLDILQVRLLVGSGRDTQPAVQDGTCPVPACTGSCFPECNPECCTTTINIPIPAAPAPAPMPVAAPPPAPLPVYQQPPPQPNIQYQTQISSCSQVPQCSSYCAPTCPRQCCPRFGGKRGKIDKQKKAKAHGKKHH